MQNNNKNPFIFLERIFFLNGIFALFAQIILVREFISVFYGNELIIAIVTAFWMVANVLGNRIAATFPKKSTMLTVILFLNAIVLLPCMLIFLKHLSGNFIDSSNTLTPLKNILWSSFFVIGPIGTLNGFLFSIGCGVTKKEHHANALNLYRRETAGFLLGGILFTFIFSSRFTNFETTIYLTYIMLITISFASFTHFKKSAIRLVFLCVPLILFFMPDASFFNAYEKLNFKNEKLIKTISGIYGKIQITEKNNQSNFYLNNFYLGCSLDLKTAQEDAFIPLCAAKEKTSVLYVGNLYNETLSELTKDKKVKSIYAPPLDIKMLNTIKPFLANTQQQALDNEKVTIPDEESRIFLKNTDTKFSTILINMGDPKNGIMNRFYTKEFFKLLKSRMTDDAVLIISLRHNQHYVSEADAHLLKSISSTLKSVFPFTKNYLSDMTLLTAAKTDILIKTSGQAAANLTIDKDTKTHINKRLIEIIFSEKAHEKFNHIINAATTNIPLNTDLRPVSYYFNLMKQSTLYGTEKFFKFTGNLRLAFWIGLSLFLSLIFYPKKKKDLPLTLFYNMSAVSFSCMLLLMCLIYSMHAFYGVAYYRISLITAVFMGGIYQGTTYADTTRSLKNQPLISFHLRFASLRFVLLLFTAFLMLVFLFFGKFLLPSAIQTLMYLLMGFYTGVFNGYSFGLLKYILEDFTGNPKTTSAKLYAFDIFGGSLGAFLCGSIFIANLGVFQTCTVAMSLVFFSIFFSLPEYKFLKNS